MHCFSSILLFTYPLIAIYADPLLLTPYLKEGKIDEARKKALVVPDINGVKSYSGYFTVNEKCGNHLFFWFLPAQKNWETAPVLLWLNSGPGSSSLKGLFTAIGPFNHLKKEGFINRKYHWTKDKSVIFFDQPVGTGYSFSEKGCFAENMTVVAEEAYSALEQFFLLFPKLQKNHFFLTGQAYAAYFLPGIANEIIKKREDSSVEINFKGIVILSPYIDKRCFRTASYLYELGILDENAFDAVLEIEEKLIKAITEKNYSAAYVYEGLKDYTQWLYSKLPNFFNILVEKNPALEFSLYIRNYKIRDSIHVGNTIYNLDNPTVFKLLINHTYEPSTKEIQKVLNDDKYTLGLFTGQLNVMGIYTSLPCVFEQLEWVGAKEYHGANRSEWYVDGRLAGWFKVGGNLFEAVVRDSGYYVAIDQPQAALELVDAVVFRKSGSKLLSTLQTVG